LRLWYRKGLSILLISVLEQLCSRHLLVKTIEGFVETMPSGRVFSSSAVVQCKGSSSATVSLQTFLQCHGFIANISAVPRFRCKHSCSAKVSLQTFLQCHAFIASIPAVPRFHCRSYCSAAVPFEVFLQCHDFIARAPAVP
jgi:hypothetical protein